MKGKPKALQEWQVYHQMTYENKWKSVIENEWEEYKKKWETESPGEKPPQTCFSFMNTFIKEKYLEETEDMQEEVQKCWENLKLQNEKEEDDKVDNEWNEVYQK